MRDGACSFLYIASTPKKVVCTMKRTCITLLAIQVLLIGSSLFAQDRPGRVVEHIHELHDRGVRFEPVSLFATVPTTAATDARWKDALAKATVLRMDGARVSTLLAQRPVHMALVLPHA